MQQRCLKIINKRNTIKILYKGKSIILTELSNLTGINKTLLEMRHINGVRKERLIFKPQWKNYFLLGLFLFF